MRIIGGSLRGRRLLAPASAAIRPTADRARETLFNMLAHGVVAFEGISIADIYAGTGALGFEALSRGAARAIFVDQNPAALDLVRRNAMAFGMEDAVGIIRADARRLPSAAAPVDVVFLDPPYRQGLVPPTLMALHRQGWLKTGSIIVVETGHDEDIALPIFLDLVKDRAVGEAKLVIAVVKTPSPFLSNIPSP